MNHRIDAFAKAKAKAALRKLLDTAAGPRLATRRRIVTARGCARAILVVAGAAIGAAFLAAVALVVVFAQGPIDLESLKPRIAASLQQKIGDRYRVTIGPTFLMRTGAGLALGFKGMEIADADGRRVVVAPGGQVGLDVLALLTLEVRVRRLELDGLIVKLRVRPDGAISVAAASSDDSKTLEIAAAPAPQAPPTPGPEALVAGLAKMLAGAESPLDHVALANGRLEVVNEPLGKSTTYDSLQVAYDKRGAEAEINVSAVGAAGAWKVSAQAGDGDAPFVAVSARDLTLDDLLLLEARRPPFMADMPISFHLRAESRPDGALAAMRGDFALGAGHFKLDDPDHAPYLIDEASGNVSWDPQNRRFRLDRFEALAGPSHFRFQGWAAPHADDASAWSGHLQSSDLLLGAERPDQPPTQLDAVAIDARWLGASGLFSLDKLTARGPHVNAEMTAQAQLDAAGVALKMNLQVGPGAALETLRLWPDFINPEARVWCLEHIHAGDLTSGSMRIDWDAAATDAVAHKRAAPADSVRGDFVMSGAAIDLLPGVPQLTGLDAVGVITGRVFEVTAKHGAMELSPGRRMQASDIFYRVPDTAPAEIVPSQGGAKVQGGAEALADLLTRDALKKYVGFSIDPANVKGQFQGSVSVDLLLGKTVRPEDQKFRAEGTLTNFQLDKYLAGAKFEQGALDIVADPASLKITGQGQINGLAAKVEVSRNGAEDGTVTLTTTVDDSARAKLGVNFGPLVAGPMNVRLKAPLGKPGAEVDIDLAKVEIDSPEGAVLKAAGKPGKASFTLKSAPDAMILSGLAMDAGQVVARGGLQLSAEGALQSAKFTQFRLSPGDDLRIDLQGGSAIKAVVRGSAFDARDLLKAFLSHDRSATGVNDLDVDMKVASVAGGNDVAMTGFELNFSRRAGQLRSLQASGHLGDGDVSARRDATGALVVKAADAGAFAKFLDFYGHLEGGALDMTPEGTAGSASLRNFVLRNEPALRRLATESAVRAGNGAEPTVADGNVEHFDRMTASFLRAAGRLDLRDALIFNPNVGLTTKGYIDYARNRVDLNGTFVPAYGLNSLVTGIPVFGVLLGGAKHEGVFGLNYRISGPASGPTLTVNPLSGVTPGILRKIFGVVDGTATAPGATPTETPEAPE